MKRLLLSLAAVALLAAGAGQAEAGLIFYTARASFDAASPGLPVETFEAARVSGSHALVNSPIDSTTNDGVFQPGDILPGLLVGNTPGSSTNGLVVTGTGAVTGTTKAVGTSLYADALSLSFTPGVSAV